MRYRIASFPNGGHQYIPVRRTLEEAAEVFWKSYIVIQRNYATPCWEWQKSKDHAGYGAFNYGGRVNKAHRFAWELKRGPIPDGLMVLHHCDNPSCINVDHCFLGVSQDNVDDMIKKGRDRKAVGEQVPRSRLKQSEVLEIRRLHSSGQFTYRSLGERFNIRHGTVYDIVHRRTWKHV